MIKTVFVVVSPAVLVIKDDLSNFQNFLRFLNISPFKRYLNGMYVSRKISVLITKPIFSIVSLNLFIFILGQFQILNQANACFLLCFFAF